MLENTTNVDNALCPNCGGQVDVDQEDAPTDILLGHLSGEVWEVVCGSCGAQLQVSPSIEWQTWAI